MAVPAHVLSIHELSLQLQANKLFFAKQAWLDQMRARLMQQQNGAPLSAQQEVELQRELEQVSRDNPGYIASFQDQNRVPDSSFTSIKDLSSPETGIQKKLSEISSVFQGEKFGFFGKVISTLLSVAVGLFSFFQGISKMFNSDVAMSDDSADDCDDCQDGFDAQDPDDNSNSSDKSDEIDARLPARTNAVSEPVSEDELLQRIAALNAPNAPIPSQTEVNQSSLQETRDALRFSAPLAQPEEASAIGIDFDMADMEAETARDGGASYIPKRDF